MVTVINQRTSRRHCARASVQTNESQRDQGPGGTGTQEERKEVWRGGERLEIEQRRWSVDCS